MTPPTTPETDVATAVSETERCKYPSKHCLNKRCRKRNGQLHRFCEEHRERANLNQKRWSSSRREEGTKPSNHSASDMAAPYYRQPTPANKQLLVESHVDVTEYCDPLESLFVASNSSNIMLPEPSRLPLPFTASLSMEFDPTLLRTPTPDDSIAVYHMLMGGEHSWGSTTTMLRL